MLIRARPLSEGATQARKQAARSSGTGGGGRDAEQRRVGVPRPAWEARLEVGAPFDFGLTLRHLAVSPLEQTGRPGPRSRSPFGVLARCDAEEYRRGAWIGDVPAVLSLRAEGPLAAPSVLAAAWTEDAVVDAAAAERLVRRMLSLEADLGTFRQAVSADNVLSGIVAGQPGLRLPSPPDPFEAAVWALLSQQTNSEVAQTLKRRLIERWGRVVALGHDDYLAFPRAQDIAMATIGALVALKVPESKATAILAVAGAVADGGLDLLTLRDLPAETAETALTALPGIGEWSARSILLRGVGHPDILPLGEKALAAAIGVAYGMERPAKIWEVRDLAEQWRPWRSWAVLALRTRLMLDPPRRESQVVLPD